MILTMKNCNNILEGQFELREGSLNIKYADNGTGKSTISHAIASFCMNDLDGQAKLKPYQFLDSEDYNPMLFGADKIKKVMTFNEEYIERYVYQQGELLKNSFEVFVKTPDYDKHMREIQELLQEINKSFQNNPELEELIRDFSIFLDGCGKSQSSISTSSSLFKAFGKGNNLYNISEELNVFMPYLGNSEDATNVKWLKWQAEGKKYLDMADQCPYCSGSVTTTKDKILKITKEFNSKTIEHLNKMILLFQNLKPYFSESTAKKVDEIINNASNMNSQQRGFLFEIKGQIARIQEHLQSLKKIGFQSFKDVDKVIDQLQNYKIDLSLYSHLNSDLMKQKVDIINNSLGKVFKSAGKLQGEVNIQKKLIEDTIKANDQAINDFLKCAGYNYQVSIKESDDGKYRTILYPVGISSEIDAVKEHLSYGERNALALALFMFSAIKENPDLIILDDPISSFDGNKKFALINMLFLSKKCLRNKTVLLLSHDFNTVIDIIYTMHHKFSPSPNATFLSNIDGKLQKKSINRQDIMSFIEIAYKNFSADIDNLCKLVYLRRLLEIKGKKGEAWQLLSNLFKGRTEPVIHDKKNERKMTNDEISIANVEIRKYIPGFSYEAELKKIKDENIIKSIYLNSKSNYEKLQIYRMIKSNNHSNPVIKKFVNETFHIENDFLFQLNPTEFDTIPYYVIHECNQELFPNKCEYISV